MSIEKIILVDGELTKVIIAESDKCSPLCQYYSPKREYMVSCYIYPACLGESIEGEAMSVREES